MAVVLPVKGSLNWDISLNAALTYLDNQTTALVGNFVDLTSNQSVGGTKSFTSPTNMSSLTLTGAGSGAVELAAQVVGDANNRYNVTAAGVQNWGSGSAAPDTNLYRGSANQLQTDDALVVGLTILAAGDVTSNGRFIENSSNDRTAYNAIYTATNTTNAAFSIQANASTARYLGATVTGDTVGRFSMLADGTMAFGPGGSTPRDTNLYRSGASILQTDQTFVAGQSVRATTNVVVGGAAVLGDNGVGEIQLTNATTVPTTNPTGGVSIYSQAGVTKVLNPQGLKSALSSGIATQISTTTVTSTGSTNLQNTTIPANDAAASNVYEMNGYGIYTTNATATTVSFTLYWGGIGGTVIATIPAFTITASQTNAFFSYRALLSFRSATSVVATITLNMGTSASTTAATTFSATSTAPVTVVSNVAKDIAVGVNFSVAQSLSLLGGDTRRIL